MKPTICLSMIVKNEAHCITKCLESVKPVITSWVISDTGSTDGTEEVVRNCLKDIPGTYIHNDWVDFSTNRNIALNAAKTIADYALIIDADDYLVIDDLNEWQDLTEVSYNIKIKHGSISYFRPQLIKYTTPAQYKGVLHEYLELPSAGVDFKNSYIFFGATGSRSKNPAKYLNDAEVFVKALEKEPRNTRYLFYCAQSFRDAGDYYNALRYYKKRASIKGWIEEDFVALWEIGKILEKLSHNSEYTVTSKEIEEAYLAAYNRYPKRNESLCYLAKYYRQKNEFHKAYFYANMARVIQRPEHALFLEDACYDWVPLDEMAISGFYIGKKEEAYALNQFLLTENKLPESQKHRVRKNSRFCERTK